MKIFKSKLFLGISVLAIMLLGSLAVSPSKASADCTIYQTIKIGSKSSDVSCLQASLGGLTVDGNFGPKTKAAVQVWQASHGLVADGIFGPKSLATWITVSVDGAYTSSLPAGCTSTSAFSSTTGQSCTVSSLPAGCTFTSAYSSTTGASCNATANTSTSLQGGAGNATISATSVDTENDVAEGTTQKVAGFKVEASGSDISVSNVQVTLQNTSTSGSTWLSRYASEVSIWMGNTKVGSLPVSAFSQSGTTYTGSIAVSNAVVREGSNNRQYFYIGLTANSTIDSNDAVNDNWTVGVNNIRYTDATGVVLTSSTSISQSNIDFQTLANSGEVKVTITRDSSNPIAQNVEVSDTGSTDNITLLAFDIKAQGTNVSIDSLPFTLTSTGTGDAADQLSQISLYDGSNNLGEMTPAEGSNILNLDQTLVISKNSTKTLTLKAKVNKTDTSTFAEGDSIKADLGNVSGKLLGSTGSAISNYNGSATGEVQSFYSEGLKVSNFISTATTNNNQNGLTTTANYTVNFKVTAFGNTYYIPKTVSTTGNVGLIYEVGTGAASSASSLTSSASTDGNYFVVNDGQSENFTASITVNKGSSTGFYRVQLDKVGYATDNTGANYTTTDLIPVQNFQTSQINIQA